MSKPRTPTSQRGLRACLLCSIVLNSSTFLREGCPNCESVLNMRGSSDAVNDCTSPVFDGLIAMARNTKSWVAKWQRIEGYESGTYAVKVSGVLPPEVVAGLEDVGISYIPRDGSAQDDEAD